MKQIKRLILVIGFVPMILISSIIWVFTGKDIIILIERFEKWCLK